MFQTVTGSLIILMVIGLIIFLFAVFIATVANWIWRTADERVPVSVNRERATASPLRKAA